MKIFKGIPDREPETLHRDRMDAIRERAESGNSVFTSGIFTPLPEERPDDLKPRVEKRADGVYWIAPKVDRESGETISNETWLSSPLEVIGTGRDDAGQYYFVLRWKTTGRKDETTRALPAGDIGEREGWRALKSGGVKVVASPGSVGDAATVELSPGAGQNVLNIRAGIISDQEKLKYLQEYILAQCR
ncbi:lysis protein [Salmonella enterica]|nr:lysis protein [Salmonella enterica]